MSPSVLLRIRSNGFKEMERLLNIGTNGRNVYKMPNISLSTCPLKRRKSRSSAGELGQIDG